MIVSLKDIFNQYPNKCAAAFNVHGYEDARAVIDAAESLGDPVILMTNKAAVEYMTVPVLASLLREMADKSAVPVCVHLDHATELENIHKAVECGYTSVMFDGSQLPYEKNAELTACVCDMAHPYGVSVEAEIGSVGYTDPAIAAKTVYTEPWEAEKFYADTGVDALAVSVGTVHRQVVQDAKLQFERLDAIRAATKVPLVIHGSTSVRDNELTLLAKHGVKKINLGTCLRLRFGSELRHVLAEDDKIFDRLEMFRRVLPAVEEEARKKMRLLDAGEKDRNQRIDKPDGCVIS